jgi:hypothetical protein
MRTMSRDATFGWDRPNIRSDTADEMVSRERAQKWTNGDFPCEFDMDQREWYPLHYAASTRSKAWVPAPGTRAEMDKQAGQVSALLVHGADPYAIFTQPIRPQKAEVAAYSILPVGDKCDLDVASELDGLIDPPHRKPKDNEDQNIEVRDESGQSSTLPFHYVQRSVIHAFLEEGGLVQPVLDLPNLQLERRDPGGRTLFLAACRSALGADASIDATLGDIEWNVDSGGYMSDPFSGPNTTTLLQYFLTRGADPIARDNHGKTALHHLLEAHDNCTTMGRAPVVLRSLQHMATSFPALVN